MNQLMEWDGMCQRCGTPSSEHTMSIFDVALICMTCAEWEQRNKDYREKKLSIKNSDSEISNDPVDW
jgi:hypothetical protein